MSREIHDPDPDGNHTPETTEERARASLAGAIAACSTPYYHNTHRDCPSCLAHVKRAYAARRRAEQNARMSLVAAHEAGFTAAAIARAAGITRQGVAKALTRSRI